MTHAHKSVEQLVPHAGNMVLIDRLVSYGEGAAIAEVDVRNDGRFSGNENQVPAWIGIEYMAQTIAAMAGAIGSEKGGSIKAGLLLGTRRYSCDVAAFDGGQTLTVKVEQWMHGDNGLAAFDCQILNAENVQLATAKLNVFQTDQTIDQALEQR